MFDKNEILSMLANGTSVEEIAKGFTEILNDANREHEKILAEERRLAEEEARLKAEEAKRQQELSEKKIAAMAHLLDRFSEYVRTYLPKVYDEELFNLDPKLAVTCLDEAYKEVVSGGLFGSLSSLVPSLKTTKSPANEKKKRVDPISDFLKVYNLL